VADETPDQPNLEWLDKLSDADSVRNYRPAQGPDEPPQAPSGRASASPQPGDAAQPGDKGPEHPASPGTQGD
jgi:hypothetical protein